MKTTLNAIREHSPCEKQHAEAMANLIAEDNHGGGWMTLRAYRTAHPETKP